jgi:hypothetical protein
MYRKMSARCNFISKGGILLRKGVNKISFGLLGTSIALPPLVFNNCTGSCANCYSCLVSIAPVVVVSAVVLGKKMRKPKGSEQESLAEINNHQT